MKTSSRTKYIKVNGWRITCPDIWSEYLQRPYWTLSRSLGCQQYHQSMVMLCTLPGDWSSSSHALDVIFQFFLVTVWQVMRDKVVGGCFFFLSLVWEGTGIDPCLATTFSSYPVVDVISSGVRCVVTGETVSCLVLGCQLMNHQSVLLKLV